MITMDQTVWKEGESLELECSMPSSSASNEKRLLFCPCELWSDTYLELITHLYLLNFDAVLQWQLLGNCAVGSWML